MVTTRGSRLLTISVPIVAFLLIESNAFGVWASYIHINSCAKSNVEVSVSIKDSSTAAISMTFPEMVRTEDSWWSKRGWLISAKEPLSDGYQSSFRDRLSDDPRENSKIDELESIELQEPFESGVKSAKYNLKIPISSLRGKYFYFGLTKEISDGGYYYTVDLEHLVKSGGCEHAQNDSKQIDVADD